MVVILKDYPSVVAGAELWFPAVLLRSNMSQLLLLLQLVLGRCYCILSFFILSGFWHALRKGVTLICDSLTRLSLCFALFCGRPSLYWVLILHLKGVAAFPYREASYTFIHRYIFVNTHTHTHTPTHPQHVRLVEVAVSRLFH